MTISTKKIIRLVFIVTILISFVILAMWLARLATESEAVQIVVANYGYVGAFLISIISGFNLVVPIPAISFLPLLVASGLSAVYSVLIIALGMTLGDMIGFGLGRAGQFIFSFNNQSVIARLEKFRERYKISPLVVLFIFSLLPLPNEILVLPLGFLRYRMAQVFPILLAGNIIFNTLVAIGFLGLFQRLSS